MIYSCYCSTGVRGPGIPDRHHDIQLPVQFSYQVPGSFEFYTPQIVDMDGTIVLNLQALNKRKHIFVSVCRYLNFSEVVLGNLFENSPGNWIYKRKLGP